MSGPFDDFLIGCASDCVNANERGEPMKGMQPEDYNLIVPDDLRDDRPDRPICEECKVELPLTARLGTRRCVVCADTQEIPQVEAK